jgi:drug/metabolite transporter (DMT)-like permease
LSSLSLYALMALHVSLASASYIFGRTAAVGFADPMVLTLLRAAGAALIFLALTGSLIPRPSFSRREWWQLAAFGFLLVPVNQYCFLRGLQHTVPSHPALLYALTPLGVLMLESLSRRRLPPPAKQVGVLLALLGVVLILRPWVQAAAIVQIRSGDLWILVAVVSWVVYTVGVRGLCRRHDPRSVTAWSLILGAAMLLAPAGRAALQLPVTEVSPEVWLSLAWLALVTSVTMMLLWNFLLRHLTAVEVAVCTNAQPPTTALLAAALAGLGWLQPQQDLGLAFLGGMLLVIIGVVLVQRPGPAHRAV